MARTGLLLGVLCGSLSCVPKVAPVVLPQQESILVSVAQDHESQPGVGGVSAELGAALSEALGVRNLAARSLNAGVQSAAFSRSRATGQRLQWLRNQSGAGERILLIETRARLVSQLAGRWRWLVSARLSLASAGSPEVLDAQLEVPVFLQFGNEGADEALALAQALLMRRLGRLLDTALAPALGEGSPELAPANQDDRGSLLSPGAPSGFIYFAMVDRFANGDPSNDGAIDGADPSAFHGGDLRGLIDRLDYLQGLGVTTLWLSPVFAMRTADFGEHGAFHGYWLEDPYRVEPRFGSADDLAELAAGLDARGMGLYLDMVTNHVAYDAARVTSHPGWFHGLGDIEDWSDPGEVISHDVHGLPDLNHDLPEVRDWLVGAGLHWIEALQPAGFRLDAVRHVPQTFWKHYNASMSTIGGADFVLAGELFDGDPGVVSSTWRAGGFTSMFDFPMYYALLDVFCGGAPAGRLASVLSADRLYDNPAGLITFVDNHDLPRAVSACDGDLDAVTAMLRFIFAVRGTPAVTWGTEAGLAGAGEPENRASMPWEAQAPLADVLRDSGRLRPALPGGRIVQLSDEGFDYLRADGSLLRVEEGRVAVLPPSGGAEADSSDGALRVAASGSPAGAGDTLVLVGAGPELGSWDAAAGLPLPIEGLVLPAGAVLDFKLVLLRPDGAVVWEDRGNRYLLIEAGMSKEIQLEWGV